MRLLIQILPWLLGAMATPVFAQFTITTNSPRPTAMVGSVYNQTLLTTGGSGNLTACQVASGTLPPSITLGTSGTSCTLSGTPTSTGSFTFEVRAFDSATPTPAQTRSTSSWREMGSSRSATPSIGCARASASLRLRVSPTGC
ncbi:MAG: putative Ig domain-containing protein, partial [Bryobacterales bacterium]|nr:putative Ig domain-containing protein [Bryobacterales bacterium]